MLIEFNGVLPSCFSLTRQIVFCFLVLFNVSTTYTTRRLACTVVQGNPLFRKIQEKKKKSEYADLNGDALRKNVRAALIIILAQCLVRAVVVTSRPRLVCEKSPMSSWRGMFPELA